jgi:hypothetical protein
VKWPVLAVLRGLIPVSQLMATPWMMDSSNGKEAGLIRKNTNTKAPAKLIQAGCARIGVPWCFLLPISFIRICLYLCRIGFLANCKHACGKLSAAIVAAVRLFRGYCLSVGQSRHPPSIRRSSGKLIPARHVPCRKEVACSMKTAVWWLRGQADSSPADDRLTFLSPNANSGGTAAKSRSVEIGLFATTKKFARLLK